MPCNSDYMAPSQKEQRLQETAQILVWVLRRVKKPVKKIYTEAAKDIYGKLTQGGEQCVVDLCALLRELPEKVVANLTSMRGAGKDADMSRKLDAWWAEHQAADAKRKKAEKKAPAKPATRPKAVKATKAPAKPKSAGKAAVAPARANGFSTDHAAELASVNLALSAMLPRQRLLQIAQEQNWSPDHARALIKKAGQVLDINAKEILRWARSAKYMHVDNGVKREQVEDATHALHYVEPMAFFVGVKDDGEDRCVYVRTDYGHFSNGLFGARIGTAYVNYTHEVFEHIANRYDGVALTLENIKSLYAEVVEAVRDTAPKVQAKAAPRQRRTVVRDEEIDHKPAVKTQGVKARKARPLMDHHMDEVRSKKRPN